MVDAAPGERIAVRLSICGTNGAYAVVESLAAPGCCVPMHLLQKEEEHFVVLEGTYRVAVEDKIFDVAPGTSVTVPKGVPHAWRNLSSSPGRLLAIFTPGGFERLVQEVISAPAGNVEELAARYGCLIVGPPIKPWSASGLIRLRNNRENYCPSDSTLLNRLSRRVPSVINHEIEEAAEREELLMPMVNRLRT